MTALAERPGWVQCVHMEDVEWMAEHGESLTGAAKRLGLQPRTLEKTLERAGRMQLLHKLRAREVVVL